MSLTLTKKNHSIYMLKGLRFKSCKGWKYKHNN